MLEQLDLFGEEVLPVLRKEYAALKPAHVPDPPTHAGRVAALWLARRKSSPRQAAVGGVMATRTDESPVRLAAETWESLFRAQVAVMRKLQAGPAFQEGGPERVRRPVHASRCPSAGSPQRTQ